MSNQTGGMVVALPLFWRSKMAFRYRSRDPSHIKARIRRYKFDDDFKIALQEAHKGKPKQLSELLRSPNQLSEEHRVALAGLIERHLQARPGKGRPPGSIKINPRQEFEERISYLVRQELARVRKQNGGRVPKGTVDQVITKYFDLFGEIHGGEPGLKDVNIDNIRNAATRGVKQKPVAS